ncbi:MAG: FMN-binding protein, partial [Gemmatimonadota bacterium]|nr:FMN-binding protein [Gemmatimonadota bacterium]
VGRRDGEALGVAYFDAHVVRTLREVLMVVLTPAAEIERIEVLDFDEPGEYRPPEGWLDEFRGLGPDDRVSTKGDVVNITGATLTSQAVARAARRVMALHRIIDPIGDDDPGSGGDDR